MITPFIIFKLMYYATQNNKWNFYAVHTSLNLSARVDKSSIYYSGYYSFRYILSLIVDMHYVLDMYYVLDVFIHSLFFISQHP